MSESALQSAQLGMAAYLRDPDNTPPPPGVEARRLKVYRELIYNNIEGFISGGFPVLRSLYNDADWEQLVRLFMGGHRCRSPYFLEISQEFIAFLLGEHQRRACDPPFMAELAHYEWVELALDVAEEELPAASVAPVAEASVLRLSPLAWVLSYHYPVHRIGPGFRPEDEEPCFLAVYRNREDEVGFVALNAATARMLELLRGNHSQTVEAVLTRLAGELGVDYAGLRDHGLAQLQEMSLLPLVVPG